MNMSKPDLRAKFIPLRRYLDLGFDIDPRNHLHNKVALASLNQNIRVNVMSGQMENVNVSVL